MKSILPVLLSTALASVTAFSFSQMAVAFEQLNPNQRQKVAKAENLLFGKTKSHLGDESRLRAIETNLFGDLRTGSNDSRIAAIEQLVNGRQSSYLLPPMAPRLDTGDSIISTSDDISPVFKAPEPDNKARAMLAEATSRYSAGDTEGARRAFLKVLKIDANNEDAYFNLGVIAESQGDDRKALDYYRKAHKLKPSDQELASTVRSLSQKLTDNDRQEKEEQRLAQQEKDRVVRQASLRRQVEEASRDYKAGRYHDATRKLTRVAHASPRDAGVHYALGQAHRAAGDLHKARIAFDRAASIDPASRTYRDALSDTKRSLGNTADRLVADNRPVGEITPFAPAGQGQKGIYERSGLTRTLLGSRIKRAVAGSAVGAAAGAIYSATTRRSGIGSGALRGAMMGGLIGYLSGQ